MRLKRTSALLVALACAVLAAPAASAQAAVVEVAPCDTAALTQPFARWGDIAYYKLAPGGDFEAGTGGWTLSRYARIVPGSEPWGVTGTVGSRALALSPGASAVSATTCVNAGAPSFRFFARSTGGLLPLLRVDLVYRDSVLGLVAVPVGTVTPGATWRPTASMLTASAVAGALSDGEADLSLRFTAVSGSWEIDDVLVDPYARG